MASENFTVTIQAISGTSPSDGFIDPNTVHDYQSGDDLSTPATLAESTTKQRAWLRWQKLQYALSTLGNIYMNSIDAPGGDANTDPTSVTFDATAEHGIDSLVTNDENNVGSFLYGLSAVKRVIARSFMAEIISNQIVYDPTLSTTRGDDEMKIRLPDRYNIVTVGALTTTIAAGEAIITVTADS